MILGKRPLLYASQFFVYNHRWNLKRITWKKYKIFITWIMSIKMIYYIKASKTYNEHLWYDTGTPKSGHTCAYKIHLTQWESKDIYVHESAGETRVEKFDTIRLSWHTSHDTRLADLMKWRWYTGYEIKKSVSTRRLDQTVRIRADRKIKFW